MFKVFHDFVLANPDPESLSHENPHRQDAEVAEVVAIGSGMVRQKKGNILLDLKKGDKIAIVPYAGTWLMLEGEMYLVLRPREIFGVFEEEEEEED